VRFAREEKCGEKRPHLCLKTHDLARTKTHIVTAVSVTDKVSNDNPQFEAPIPRTKEAGLPLMQNYADKACSARRNYVLTEELGFELYVLFRSKATARATSHANSQSEGPATTH
jgi:hypothetical protein